MKKKDQTAELVRQQMLSELSKDARTLRKTNHNILISKNATRLDSIDGK